MSLPRRTVALLPLAACAGGLPLLAQAQPKMVDEKDPKAVALGYYADAKKVDKAKWPKYAAGQLCSNCALYQGKPTDKAAACGLFPGQLVAGPGWCNAYVKKA